MKKLLYITYTPLDLPAGNLDHVVKIVNGMVKLGWEAGLIAPYLKKKENFSFIDPRVSLFPQKVLPIKGRNIIMETLLLLKLFFVMKIRRG